MTANREFRHFRRAKKLANSYIILLEKSDKCDLYKLRPAEHDKYANEKFS